jgi:hypothetical protein
MADYLILQLDQKIDSKFGTFYCKLGQMDNTFDSFMMMLQRIIDLSIFILYYNIIFKMIFECIHESNLSCLLNHLKFSVLHFFTGYTVVSQTISVVDVLG